VSLSKGEIVRGIAEAKRLVRSARALGGDEWPSLDACGGAGAFYFLREEAWIARHVESLEVVSDSYARRRVTIDLDLPRDPAAAVGEEEDGTLFCVPRTYLAKSPPSSYFDVRDQDGAVVPLMTREENAEISFTALLGNADEVPYPQFEADITDVVYGTGLDATLGLAVLVEQTGMGEPLRAWPRHSPAAPASGPSYAALPGSGGSSSCHTTSSRGALRGSSASGPSARSSSRTASATSCVSRPRPRTLTAHLYASAARLEQPAPIRLSFRAQRRGFLNLSLATALFTALGLWFAQAHAEFADNAQNTQTAAAVLLDLPALLALFAVRPAEHALVSRLLFGVRALVFVSGLVAVLAAAALAGVRPSAWEDVSEAWIWYAALASGAGLMVVVAWAAALRPVGTTVRWWAGGHEGLSTAARLARIVLLGLALATLALIIRADGFDSIPWRVAGTLMLIALAVGGIRLVAPPMSEPAPTGFGVIALLLPLAAPGAALSMWLFDEGAPRDGAELVAAVRRDLHRLLPRHERRDLRQAGRRVLHHRQGDGAGVPPADRARRRGRAAGRRRDLRPPVGGQHGQALQRQGRGGRKRPGPLVRVRLRRRGRSLQPAPAR
jgi:hypothetical protein